MKSVKHCGRVEIGPIEFDRLTIEMLMDWLVDQMASSTECHQVMGGNSNHVYIASQNHYYAQICKSSAIFFADGQSIVIASMVAGASVPERIAGPDLMLKITSECAKKGFTIFLLGGDEAGLKRLQQKFNKASEGVIAGIYSPPFGVWSKEENHKMVTMINDSGADLLLAGISTPKQDVWIYEHKNKLKTKVAIGLGAAFDFHSGRIKRAPQWMQEIGLEWFHRFLQEPKRMWRRYVFANTYLIVLLIKMIFKKH